MRVDHVFEAFNVATGANRLVESASEEPLQVSNFDCLKVLMTTYDKSCGKMEDYSL